MRRFGLVWLVGAVALAGCGVACVAQVVEPMEDSMSFSFERQGMPVPKYVLTVFERGGQVVYSGEEAAKPGGPTGAALPAIPGQAFRQEAQLSGKGAEKIFATVRRLKFFNIDCGTRAKNMADTGAKVLLYAGQAGKGACAYHYSDNKDVTALTGTLQGIAQTLDEGRKLDRMRRFDRLGLDAELAGFQEQVAAGFAVEVGTIAETLKAIAGNTEVMVRARGRAEALLKGAELSE